MATDKPKILLILDDDLLKRIEDYRFENRVNSRAEAIRRLLEGALSKYNKKPKK
jgi:metal-responsive CopG/Arc/MetJ family transcriptional regulator